MANVSPTIVSDYKQYDVITWGPLNAGDVGLPVDVAQYGEISVQAVGNATSVAMTGTNDGATFATIGGGVTLTLASGTSPVTRIAEHPKQIQVGTVTGGTATTVYLVGRKLK